MVHEDQGQPVGHLGQPIGEPVDLAVVEAAVHLAFDQRVEREDAQIAADLLRSPVSAPAGTAARSSNAALNPARAS